MAHDKFREGKGNTDNKVKRNYIAARFEENRVWPTQTELNHPALAKFTSSHRVVVIQAIRNAESLDEAEENLRALVFNGKGPQRLEDSQINAIKSILKQKGW